MGVGVGGNVGEEVGVEVAVDVGVGVGVGVGAEDVTSKMPDLINGRVVAADGKVIVQVQAPTGALAGNIRFMLSSPYAS